jgi:hypothetical protein
MVLMGCDEEGDEKDEKEERKERRRGGDFIDLRQV